MKVDTESPTTKRAQEGILELLLANHPLDCPVCDKGGECPLQDQAFSHGPGESRYVEEKRHYEKPIPISDLVLLDRERCILCDRCTRFADEVAGDPLIHFTQRGNQTQVHDVPRRAVLVVLLRQHRADLPRRRARPPRRTASRPARGTSSRSRARAPRARSAAGSSCSPAATSSCATSASTATRSTGAGCATRAASASRPSNSDDRLATPLRARRAGSGADGLDDRVVERRHDRCRAARHRGARRRRSGQHRRARRGPRHERGRLRLGCAWPTRSASRTATPSSATGCRPTLLAPPAGHHRRRRRGRHGRAARAGPQGGAARPLPAPAPRRPSSAPSSSSSSSPTATGLTPYAWRSVRVEAGRGRRPCSAALADHEVADQLALRPRRHRRRAGQPGRVVPTPRRPACGPCSTPARRRHGAAGAAPRQRGRRAAARPAPRSTTGSMALGILVRRRRGRVDLLVLLGADPIARLPRRRPGPPGHRRRRRIIAVDTFLTESSGAADVVLAGRRVRREGRDHDQPRGPGHRGRPEGHRGRHVASGLDDRRRAGRLLGLRGRRRRRSPSSMPITDAIAAGVPAYAAATRVALRGEPATACSPCRPPMRPAFDALGDVAVHPTANSYDYRLVVSAASCTTSAVGRPTSPSLAPLARPSAAHVNPLDLDRIGVAERGRPVRIIAAPRAPSCFPLAADAGVPRGTLRVPFNDAGTGAHRHHRRHRAGHRRADARAL